MPDSAIFELTYNCNYCCKFCYAPWLEDASLYGRELEISGWIEAAELLLARGVRHILLSGGEPLLKPGITGLIDFLIRHPSRPAFTVYTNGSLVDGVLIEQLKGTRGALATSLPGVKCYSELTGSPRTVYDMIDLLDQVHSSGVPVSVGITVTRRSLKELKQLVSLAVLAGAASVQVVPFVPEGRGLHHPELQLTYREIETLNSTVARLRKRIKVPVYFHGELYCSCREAPVKPAGLPSDYAPPACSIEERSIVVGPDGQCRKCLHTLQQLGDVRALYSEEFRSCP
ncbi:radical SAM protein [Victivallis vadensis]|uniref:radical SAM protein n=1 Tax=Victivallis vadensis TaxID=172901 RepID=UPI00266C1057|nr:radical SAM protein [Victivallis vadensis]